MVQIIENILYILRDIFSTGDIIAIIVAFIALRGVKLTNREMKNINKSNEKFNAKWNQKNIDATLVANARIEWIQEVRFTTAELISQYFLIINTKDKDILTETILETREKTELLILYFGPEDKDIREIGLYDKKSNSGKNRSVVKFLVQLYNKTYIYYENIMSDEKLKLIKIRDRRLDKFSQNLIRWDYDETDKYVTEEGEVYRNICPVLKKDYEEELESLDEKIEELGKVSKEIEESLSKLRDIMRIYLKIEWGVAKRGI